MGYMGFGMRKEVYTRKPKKAFNKIKEIYGDDVNTPKSKKKTKLKGPSKYVKHSYKPFYKSRPYLIFKRVLFITIITTITWFVFLQEPYFKYQQHGFEENEFSNLYRKQLIDYQNALDFLKTRSDKIVFAYYSSYSNRYDLKIQYNSINKSTNNKDIHYITFDGLQAGNQKTNNDIIFEGTLTIERDGYLTKTYQNNWKYGLIDVTPKQIPNSIIEYLDTDKQQLSNFLHNIKGIDESVHVKSDSICLPYSHGKFGWYTLVYSTKELKSNTKIEGKYEYHTIVGKLDENVYWVRKDRERRSKKD